MSSTNSVDSNLVAKAVKSLLDFEIKRKEEKDQISLIGEFAKPVLVQFQLRSTIGKPVIRPIRIPVPNTLFSHTDEGHNICAFIRSEDKEEIEAAIKAQDVEGISRVITINEVRKLYGPYKDRKKLLSEHTHFVCDSRVMNQLFNLLGNVFSARNNYPVPLDYVNSSKFGKAIALFKDSTYMHLNGQNITIRFGHTAMSANAITKNVLSGVEFAVAKIPHQWGAIHSIHLKSSDSASLPIYSKLPSEAIDYLKAQIAKEDVKESGDAAKKSKKVSAKKGSTPAPEPQQLTPAAKKVSKSAAAQLSSTLSTVSESSTVKSKSSAKAASVSLAETTPSKTKATPAKATPAKATPAAKEATVAKATAKVGAKPKSKAGK